VSSFTMCSYKIFRTAVNDIVLRYPDKLLSILSHFNQMWISLTFLITVSSIKFHENPSIGVELIHEDGWTR